MPIYGDQQSQMTMNRAAYGNQAAMLMASGQQNYGSPDIAGDPLAQIGANIRPVTYSPPPRINVGFYGMYQQQTGIFSSLSAVTGMHRAPRGMYTMDYGLNAAGDLGERVSGGAIGGALSIGATLGGGAVGSGIASMTGAGLIGGMALGLGGYMAGGFAAQKIQEGVAQRRDIQNFLESSSFRFVGQGSPMADPRGQSGMSVSSRQGITDFIKQQEIKDPFMSMGDMTNVLKQSVNMGMFSGTQDMNDFKAKFKDITDAVKTVTRTLHTTLEEGLKTVKELRAIGIDPSQVKSLVGSADMLGRMAGRTAAEMVGVGIQGAEMFRGTGVSMQVGMQATMMNMASVRASRDAGLLSQEAIAQAGGEEALAARMTGSGLAYAQSAQGRGFGAAFFKGGAFNQNSFMSSMMGGGGSLIGMAQQAAGNLSSPAALIAYEANQDKFISEMGKAFGGRGLQMQAMGAGAAMATYLAGATGASKQDAYKLSRLQAGASVSEIEAEFAMMKNPTGQMKAAVEAAAQTQARSAAEANVQGTAINRAIYAVERGASTIVDMAARPISRAIDAVSEGAKNAYMKNYLGMESVSTSGMDLRSSGTVTTTTRTGGRTLSGTSIDELQNDGSQGLAMGVLGGAAVGGLVGALPGAVVGGTIGALTFGAKKLMRALGTDTMDDKVSKAIMAGDRSLIKEAGIATRETSKVGENDTILANLGGGKYLIASNEDAKKLQQYAARSVDLNKAKEMDKAGLLEGVGGKSLGEMIGGGRLTAASTKDQIAMEMFGKSAKDLTAQEQAKLQMTFGEKGGYSEMLQKGAAAAKTVAGAEENAAKKGIIAAVGDRTKAVEEIQKAVGGDTVLPDTAIVSMAMANAEKDPKKKEALVNEARESIFKANNKSPDAVKSAVESAMKKATELSAIDKANGEIGANKRALQSTGMGAALYDELTMSKLKGDDFAAALAAGEQVMGAQGVSAFTKAVEENKKSLKLTTVGQTMIKNAETLTKLASAKEDDYDMVTTSGASKDLQKQMMFQLKTSGKIDSDTLQKLKQEQDTMAVADVQTTNTTGGANPDALGGKNAADNAATQMNINLQILQAMSAMATRLGVR